MLFVLLALSSGGLQETRLPMQRAIALSLEPEGYGSKLSDKGLLLGVLKLSTFLSLKDQDSEAGVTAPLTFSALPFSIDYHSIPDILPRMSVL